MQLIDLSGPIVPNQPELPDPLRTEIAFHDHAEGAAEIERAARACRRGCCATARAGPPRSSSASARTTPRTWTRRGTTTATIEGEPAQTIDELPLEWFFSDGVVLDMTAKGGRRRGDRGGGGGGARALGHELKPLDIVLVHTGRDEFFAELDYIARGPGVTPEATHWLFDRGVRVMGIDAWGWDRPLHLQAQDALAADEPGVFWAAHQADLPYSQIERLVNLGALPPTGFKVACFPLRIAGASAAPARVVAMVE